MYYADLGYPVCFSMEEFKYNRFKYSFDGTFEYVETETPEIAVAKVMDYLNGIMPRSMIFMRCNGLIILAFIPQC